jgi:hypothetical protein
LSKRTINSLPLHQAPVQVRDTLSEDSWIHNVIYQIEATNDAYVGFLFYSSTTCATTSLTSYAYMKSGLCNPSTDTNGTTTGYYKYWCSASSGVYYSVYSSTDSTCSNSIYDSTMFPLNVCPMDGMSAVLDCATLSEVNEKWKKINGIVYRYDVLIFYSWQQLIWSWY